MLILDAFLSENQQVSDKMSSSNFFSIANPFPKNHHEI